MRGKGPITCTYSQNIILSIIRLLLFKLLTRRVHSLWATDFAETVGALYGPQNIERTRAVGEGTLNLDANNSTCIIRREVSERENEGRRYKIMSTFDQLTGDFG